MLVSQSPPNGTRLGYIAQIENHEWIVTLGGYGRDFPPLEDKGFLEFARGLPSPKFYQAIQDAKPVSPIYAHRATANRLRHYEKARLPQGFVALGDAVCALCPVYGQGMTVSALSVLVLRDWLHQYPLAIAPLQSFRETWLRAIPYPGWWQHPRTRAFRQPQVGANRVGWVNYCTATRIKCCRG